MLFMPKPNTTEIKTLNAKKLDIKFDNDDFFNSFEPSNPKKEEPESAFASNKFVSKLQEV